MSKIGIFGGSFNPVHKGHTSLVKELLFREKIDRVIVVPVFTPPHKSSKDLCESIHRINMLKIAFDEEINKGRVFISSIETEIPKPSYSFETVRKLKELYPKDELFFLLGSDMLLSFRQWKNWQDILKNVSLLAVSRQKGDRNLLIEEKNYLQSLGAGVIICDIDIKEISSTEVRKLLKENRETDGILDSRVRDYIQKNNLYV